jgi:hypothetical protein
MTSPAFHTWITEQFDLIGFQSRHSTHRWFNFDNGKGDVFHIYYVEEKITATEIRRIFGRHELPIMFVVNEAALPALDSQHLLEAPLWFRVLHAIYYGRVYVWRGDHLEAIHINWDADEYAWSGKIDIDGVAFKGVDSMLRKFPGYFDIARFYDRAFWKQAKQSRTGQRRQSRAGAYTYNSSSYSGAYQTCQQAADLVSVYFSQMYNAGSLAAARKLYYKLARQHHPDVSDHSGADEHMKAINAAFDRVKLVYS